MEIKDALKSVASRRDLGQDEIHAVMRSIMAGDVSAAQIAGFLIALRMKGETAAEIAGAALAMREFSLQVPIDSDSALVDTCGTGGDGAHTFNISTAAAFVVAAAGARVAKHGNRSVSSQSGSADVLEAAGITIDLDPGQVGRCIEEIGIGFMYAPVYHQAMRHAGSVRKELGLRTIFNLLGPLTNPARALYQLVGVYDSACLVKVSEALSRLGCERALVIHGDGGLDEISISGPTEVVELRNGVITHYHISPEDYGIPRSALDEIKATSVADSLRIMREVLNDRPGPHRAIVALNAGAALYVSGLAENLAEGVRKAFDAIGSGAALAKLESLAQMSRKLSSSGNHAQ